VASLHKYCPRLSVERSSVVLLCPNKIRCRHQNVARIDEKISDAALYHIALARLLRKHLQTNAWFLL
jgi:NAD-dependent DNA ligase